MWQIAVRGWNDSVTYQICGNENTQTDTNFKSSEICSNNTDMFTLTKGGGRGSVCRTYPYTHTSYLRRCLSWIEVHDLGETFEIRSVRREKIYN